MLLAPQHWPIGAAKHVVIHVVLHREVLLTQLHFTVSAAKIVKMLYLFYHFFISVVLLV